MARPRRNDFLIPTLGVVFDALAIEASFLLAYWIRFHTDVLSFLSLQEDTPPLDAYITGSLVIVPIWLLIFNSRKMYGARRNVPLTDELTAIVKLVTFGMLVVMSAAFFYRAFSYSRVVFGLLWGIAIVSIFCGRAMLNAIERAVYQRGRELRNAAIIGCNAIANRVFLSLHNHPLLGYRFVGYFGGKSAGDSPLASTTFLGSIEDAPARIKQDRVELALIALEPEDHHQLYGLLQKCEGVNVEFMVVPNIVELMSGQMVVKEIEGIPFIRLKGVPMTTWGRILKRTFDALLSFLLLFILSPVMLLIALIVKLDSRGPVLFRQERLGMDGRTFNILKFRSMHTEAETETGPVWSKPGDLRATRSGNVLRRTSLDELPQLLNVLKGDMSLVGPRPERPYFVDQFKEYIPKYLDRHRLKTGMTGWAQVNGLRGNTSLEERIRYDIYYIENWSLWFDVKILLKTIGAVLKPGK